MPAGPAGASAPPSLRIDKWLWYARFVKTRALAAGVAEAGKIRLNGQPVLKAHQVIRLGDVLTLNFGPRITVVRVLNLGVRRGPATEAALLYEHLTPPAALPATREPWTDGL